MRGVLRLSPILALTLAAGLGVSIAGAQTSAPPGKPKPNQCFFMRDWQGSKPSKDSKTLYIRVSGNAVYRLDLAYACTDLQNIDAKVVNRSRGGTDSVCGPLDLDLSVYTPPGMSSPCMVKTITPLTRDQAKALAPEEQP
jgi:hypothetical protein